MTSNLKDAISFDLTGLSDHFAQQSGPSRDSRSPKLTMKKKKKVSTPKSDPESWLTTEEALIEHLEEDLLEAWEKLKKFSLSLGEQKVYASGKAIMFSKKVCFFFVRPKKSFLEVVLFLPESQKRIGFKSAKAVSKTKWAHTFKLVHPDQVEGDLTDAIESSFNWAKS